uniref:Uncharacterized protein n=1 Tax=Ditylenchus dipsaci TaxID=166011 RepID=A0A915ELE3_9BILA
MNPDGSAFAKYDIYNRRDNRVPGWVDSALIKIYEETTAHLQGKVNKKGWNVGDQCMALFEDVLLSAASNDSNDALQSAPVSWYMTDFTLVIFVPCSISEELAASGAVNG